MWDPAVEVQTETDEYPAEFKFDLAVADAPDPDPRLGREIVAALATMPAFSAAAPGRLIADVTSSPLVRLLLNRLKLGSHTGGETDSLC